MGRCQPRGGFGALSASEAGRARRRRYAGRAAARRSAAPWRRSSSASEPSAASPSMRWPARCTSPGTGATCSSAGSTGLRFGRRQPPGAPQTAANAVDLPRVPKPKFQVCGCISGVFRGTWGCPRGAVYWLHLSLTSRSSKHRCWRGLGLVRNWKVSPDSTSSMVLATIVPS